MITFTAGGIDLTPHMENGYSIDISPVTGSNGFTAENGDVISDKKGDKITVSATLKNVPTAKAEKIERVLRQDEFSCTISAPGEITVQFKMTSYVAAPKNKGALWDMRFTIESASLYSSGDRL